MADDIHPNSPSLGVLVTYFNERELLRSCLESALAGPDGPDEALVFDNGSEYPASDYIPADARVRVIRHAENKGPSFARNRLIEESRSDYVHFQDADDIFLPGWTARLRVAFDSGSPELVLNQVSAQPSSGPLRRECLPFNDLASDGDLVRFSLEHGIWTQCGTVRRSLIERAGGFDETLWHNEDMDFYLRLALAQPRYTVVPEPLVLLQDRSGSLSKKRLDACRQSIRFFEKTYHLIPKDYHRIAAEQVASLGAALYQFGDIAEARKAIALAKRFGKPRYIRCGTPLYARAARWLGIENAERLRRLLKLCAA